MITKKYIVSICLMLMVGLGIIIYYENLEPQQPEQLIIPPTTEEVEPEEEMLNPIYPNESNVAYSLQNDTLQVTWDDGLSWTKVPIVIDSLFTGEYNGNKEELIENSFVMTKDMVAFLYQSAGLQIIYTDNKGVDWKEVTVAENAIGMRYRKVDFLAEDFWYVLISGERTMSQEGAMIYYSVDQGTNWHTTNMPNTTRLIADGGFVNNKTGFIAYGTINPDAIDMYVTNDVGETWNQVVVQMPSKYDRVFVLPNAPYQVEDKLEMIVDQGPNGDYMGGYIQGKFQSSDQGHTWEFVEEVDPTYGEEN
ncbi:WD40/YVTN/BNR-like repeat-containing protein [Gracilibacillus marinus]|uniref:WD40/YVTN/BNR-like repeat-containing protein n=1 Tax=Gracilibacillus marinus TaxID=630535 RepID=A0ABV8VYI1_9BACI